MAIHANRQAVGIQLDRALAYGKILFLSFVATGILALGIGPQAGWLFFVVWAVLCGFAARWRHMLAWTVLCLSPLALFSLLWLADLDSEDPFGLRWVYIFCFAGASMVTAATGILALLPRDTAPRTKPLSAQGSNQA